MGPSASGCKMPASKRSSGAANTINSVGHDVLCLIFAFLDFFDLVRCSVVCKSWNYVINKSKLLEVFYYKQHLDFTGSSKMSTRSKSLKQYLEELAMEHHRLALEEGSIQVDQWRGHSAGVDQCRMKMGLILTGVGDKVMRLWSVGSYKCLEEYSIPETDPLIDFDFDESKIIGLVGNRICIWKRNGTRSLFPSHESTFAKGFCMRYFDPEAVVGCEDGTARVFDMYSRKCSRIIRMHAGPMTCLCLSDDQLIISGSSLGSVKISGFLSDQHVATLRSTNSAGIRALCFNPSTHLVFAGSTSGYVNCWDLRTMKSLWERRVSPNVVYTLQHLRDDTSSLVVGGIDGVLRVLNQNTGEVNSSCVMEAKVLSSRQNTFGLIERKKGRRMFDETSIDSIPRSFRPPITCLAVGMKKVVSTHNGKYIRLWKFNK